MAGVSVLPQVMGAVRGLTFEPYVVEYVTHFPREMSLEEYRRHKSRFENKDKVETLLSTFLSSGRIREERFEYHGNHTVWRVTYASERDYQDWMKLTGEVRSHMDDRRESAGFHLEVRVRS